MTAPAPTWWFPAVPRGRIAVLRRLAYAFVLVDVLVTTRWVGSHARTPQLFYQPLRIARMLHLPEPTSELVTGLRWVVLAAAAAALVGRAQRATGVVVAVSYAAWMLVAMSYGKVDHDRFGYLVLLAVLPTVGAARADDHRTDDPTAGWAVRCTQVACVLTYFFASFAKFRFGGLAWLDSATLTRAVLRRGTALGDHLLDIPGALHAAQYLLVGAELASPLLLVPGRIGRVAVAAAYGFHLMVFATVAIIFLPHLVAMTAFLPLERMVARVRGRASSPMAGASRTSSPAPQRRSR